MALKTINVINSTDPKPAVVTIGTFDGVHVGHQKIIHKLVNLAKEKNLTATVLTFFPHPRMVLQKDANIKLINTIDEKSKILEGLAVDQLVIKTFTKDFSRLTALEFVRDILVNGLNTKKIIVGYDHHFGRNRTANIEDLKEFGETYDFEVVEISAKEINEVAVSSTKIREALLKGDIKRANKYLGYKFMLNGQIIKGKGLGKQMQFPTANLRISEDYKLIPKVGSYVVSSRINGNMYYGMMNIGYNPTVSSSGDKSIEIHFFDLDSDLYDRIVEIELLDRLRDEQKFNSQEELQLQLQKDKENALVLLQDYND